MAEPQKTPEEIRKENEAWLNTEAALDSPDFQTKFQETYVRRDNILKDSAVQKLVVGSAFKNVNDHIRRQAKAAGMEYQPNELDLPRVEDVYDKVHQFHLSERERLTAELEELKKAGGKTNDEAIKALQHEKDELAKKLEVVSKTYKETASEYETYKTTAAQREKEKEVQISKESLRNKAKFKPGMDDLAVEGFWSKFEKNHTFNWDEQGKIYLGDKDGKPIMSKKANGVIMQPDEILESFGKENKVWNEAPAGGKPVTKATIQPGTPTPGGQGYVAPARRVHPSLQQ